MSAPGILEAALDRVLGLLESATRSLEAIAGFSGASVRPPPFNSATLTYALPAGSVRLVARASDYWVRRVSVLASQSTVRLAMTSQDLQGFPGVAVGPAMFVLNVNVQVTFALQPGQELWVGCVGQAATVSMHVWDEPPSRTAVQ